MLRETNVDVGDAFCNFPLYDASGALAKRMELCKGAWGNDAPSFDGERRLLGSSLTLQFSNTSGASFGKVRCCYGVTFPYITGTGNA